MSHFRGKKEDDGLPSWPDEATHHLGAKDAAINRGERGLAPGTSGPGPAPGGAPAAEPAGNARVADGPEAVHSVHQHALPLPTAATQSWSCCCASTWSPARMPHLSAALSSTSSLPTPPFTT